MRARLVLCINLTHFLFNFLSFEAVPMDLLCGRTFLSFPRGLCPRQAQQGPPTFFPTSSPPPLVLYHSLISVNDKVNIMGPRTLWSHRTPAIGLEVGKRAHKRVTDIRTSPIPGNEQVLSPRSCHRYWWDEDGEVQESYSSGSQYGPSC